MSLITTEENVATVQPTAVPSEQIITEEGDTSLLSNFGGEAPLDIDFLFGKDVTPFHINLTPQGASEWALLTSSLVGQDKAQLKEEYGAGALTGINLAHEELSKKTKDSKLKKIEEDINLAQTPEDVKNILETGKDSFIKPLSMMDYRKNYVMELVQPTTGRIPRIDETIDFDARLSEEAAKLSEKLWEESSFLDIVKDFGEIIIPTGIVSEEYQKLNNSLSFVLDKIKEAPKEKQREVFDAAVKTWLDSETLLLNNSNSVLIADQLEGLKGAIQEGGLGYLNGELTEEQAWDKVETALNATFLGGEIKGLYKGFKGILGFLTSRFLPKEVVNPQKERITITFDTRGNAVALDAVGREKPRVYYNQADGKTLAQLAEEQGLSPEDAAMRYIPTPSPETEIGLPNATPNVIDLIEEDVLVLGEKRGLQLQKETGGTLELIDSGVAIVKNDVPDSLGDFKLLYGNGQDGFASVEEATTAMNKGLLGVEKEVVEKNGKWYVEAKLEHQFDPYLDVGRIDIDVEGVSSKLGPTGSYLLDPLRRLGGDFLKGVFALKSYNRSFAQKAKDELHSIFATDETVAAKLGLKPLKSEEVNDLVHALKLTDADGQDWFADITEYAEALGKTERAVAGTWKRYQRIQGLMDQVYHIRNNNYRKWLTNNNVKQIDLEIEGVDDLKGIPVSDTKNTPVYNPKTGKDVEELDDSLAVVQVLNPIPDGKGMLRRYVAVPKESVKPVGRRVLNQRKGHLDRFYRDTGWTVKVKKARIVDGVEEEYSKTTHIVESKKEADKIAKELKEKGENVEALRARENDELEGIYGDNESVQYGYRSAHTKQRGEILKGADGMEATPVGVLESLTRTVGGIERQLDVDILNNLRGRFLKTFSKYLSPEAKGAYNGDFNKMIDSARVPKEVADKAKQYHNYIESLSKLQSGAAFKAIDNLVDGTLQYLNKALEVTGVSKKGLSSDAQKISSLAQNFTTQLYIVGRPLFQIPQNFLQLTYVAQKYPVEGAKAIARMPSVLSALKNPSKKNITTLSKTMNISEELAAELIKDIQTNGLWDAVGMSDDFMRMVSKESVDAAATKKGNAATIAKNSLMYPLRISKGGQEGVLKLVNLTAYLAEFEKQVLKGGRKFNNKTKIDMNFNVQKITQTQNSINQFAYQDKASLFSVMFQFTQHVHKLFLDVIVDPAVKLTTGKNIGLEASPLASSRLQAMGSLMATYAVFGPTGVFGNSTGGMMEDYIAQIENPYIKNALQANLLNELVNGTANFFGAEGKVDVSAKMNPASFVDSLYDFHIKAAIEDKAINAFGAVGSMTGQVADTTKAVFAIATAPKLGLSDKASGIVSEVLSNVAGISDAEKAYVAYHLGNFTYKGTLSGNLSVTKYEAIMQALNLSPAAVEDRFSEFSGGGSKNKSAVEKIARLWSREMHRNLAEAASLEEMLEVAQLYSEIAQASVDPLQRSEVVRVMSSYVSEIGDKTYFDYIKPYIERKDLGDVIFELKALREDAGTEEMKKDIDDAILFLEPMTKQIQQTLGGE